MFREERTQSKFQWSMLGDIALGRPNLGTMTSVAAYRLMQFTMRDVLIQHCGVAVADEVFYESGKVAGWHFYKNLLPEGLPLNQFVNQLQQKLEELQIGMLRVEKADRERLTFTITVAEDLDCSGLPLAAEQICTYDEGFIAGILQAYAGCGFSVKEIDCWCSGDRVCRFDVKPESI